MQRFIARASIEELSERGIEFDTATVLELGAGRGGFTEELEKACKNLVATDIYRAEVFDDELRDVDFRTVDVTEPFPFDDSEFDFVYCSSLVEHLPHRGNLYREIARVLKPAGTALVSFPPFWSLSLVGGHQYKPWHFLGEPIAVAVASRRLGMKIDSYAHDYGRGGLYPLTVDRLRQELSAHRFEVVDEWSRLTANTLKLPGILADLFTWHACFLLSVEEGSSGDTGGEKQAADEISG